MRKLATTFGIIAIIAAVIGSMMTINSTRWLEVGKALLTLAVTFTVGGTAAVLIKGVEHMRDDKATWHNLLRDIVEVHQTLTVARQLMWAHKTAKTYNEQNANILKAQLTLRRVWHDPLVANEKTSDNHDSIRSQLERMIDYVDRLGKEYVEFYLPVARQQLIDELYLKSLKETLASLSEDPAPDGPIYRPTKSWRMLLGPDGKSSHLRAFLEDFDNSDFIQAFDASKQGLERHAGIKPRKAQFKSKALPLPDALQLVGSSEADRSVAGPDSSPR